MNLRALTRRAAVAGLLAIAAAWLEACGGARPPFSTLYGGSMPLTLVNDSPEIVCYVFMGPSTESGWGTDWLGSSEVIARGAQRTFMISAPGDWDVRVQNCNHVNIAERVRIPLAGPSTLAVSTLATAATTAPSTPAPVRSGPTMGGSLYGN